MAKNKKKEFMDKKAMWRQSNRVILLIGGFLALAVIAFLTMNKASMPDTVTARWEGGDYNTGQQVSYQDQIIGMTQVALAETGDGTVGFPLEKVEQVGMVDTNYFFNNGSQRVPIICYISPEGRVVVAVGMCEPCQSESFHISGEELVCDSCNTKWRLNELQGVSGGCATYPPEELNYTVEDGMIRILESDLQSWAPRKV